MEILKQFAVSWWATVLCIAMVCVMGYFAMFGFDEWVRRRQRGGGVRVVYYRRRRIEGNGDEKGV